MFIVVLIGAFISIFVITVLSLEFPAFSDVIATYVDGMLFYMSQGMDIVWLFLPRDYTITLIILESAVEVIIITYRVIMWSLRKLPVAAIK